MLLQFPFDDSDEDADGMRMRSSDEKEIDATARHPTTTTTTRKDASQSNKNMSIEKPTSLKSATSASDPPDDAQQSESGGSLRDYFRVFNYTDRLDRVLYGIAFLGAIAAGVTLPVMTIVFGSSTSTFNQYASGVGDAGQFQASINHLVLYFVYIFVARFVISYISTLFACIAAARTTNTLRKAFLDSLLRQEVSYFDTQGNGSPATQVTTNGNRINQGIAEKLITTITGLSLFISAFVVALAIQWKLALITMSVIPAIFVATGVPVAADAPIEARIIRMYSKAATIAQDALSSIKTVYAFGAQDKIIEWYDEHLIAAWVEGQKKSIIYGILYSGQTFLVLCGTALAFWQGFRMFQSGEIANVGTVFTVVLCVVLGATSTLLILPQITAFTNASSAATELFSVIDKPSKLDPLASNGERPAGCAGAIELRNLEFAYPSRPQAPVLKDLNLVIPAGKTTALVGPSGCGKSTIVGLLERWYQPTDGRIILDGRDLASYNTKWLRSSIRLVQQEPTLFQGTVFENVAKGLVGPQLQLDANEQMRLVEQACQAADAHDFIQQLPHGYDTPLGEGARMLSGGQRQRVSIARSIVSDPRILLFDEATSALDPRAERVVQDALDRVSQNKTTLIIAHKLATVMAADNIAVMSNGKVVEQGTHSQLLRSDGLYAAMVRAQDLGQKDADPDTKEEEEAENERRRIMDDTLDQSVSLKKTRSKTAAAELDADFNPLTAGTVNRSLISCIFTMLKEHRDLYVWYAVIFGGDLVVGATYPGQAVLFSRLINVFTLQGAEAQRQANFYSLMFFILAIGNLIGYFWIGIACNKVGQTITYRTRKEMLQRILSFDLDFFDCAENASGSLTAKLSSAPTALQELMSANLGLIGHVTVNIFASSILGIVYGWKLGLTLVFGGLTVIVGSGYIRIRLDQRIEAATDKQFSSSAALAAEAVGAIRTVSLLTLEEPVMREYGKTLDSIVSQVIRSLVPTLLPYAFSQSADFLVLALGFWYGSRLIASGEYTVQQFFVIFIAIVFGGQAAAQFFTFTTSITKATGSANYLFWLRKVKPSIAETERNRGNGPSGDDVEIDVEDVDFRYRQRISARVLRGVSMKITPGTFAAFVGPSGCGKSTIVSLLVRFYDPTSGRMMLNGKDISQMSPSLYRRHMSLVQQEPPLYMTSVRENIVLGLDYEPTEEEIRIACRDANALEFVSSLPEGLNTYCGSRGLQFSGGQRQRIAVARALIRKPRLLLLDEATSALDTHSERVVQKALDEAASSRTTIAVAHRLSTIRHADVIFVIEDGKIAETGTHEELQKLNGRYHAMCLAQSLDQA